MSQSISRQKIQSVREQQHKFKPGTYKYLELQSILDKIFAERFLVYTTGERSNEILD